MICRDDLVFPLSQIGKVRSGRDQGFIKGPMVCCGLGQEGSAGLKPTPVQVEAASCSCPGAPAQGQGSGGERQTPGGERAEGSDGGWRSPSFLETRFGLTCP